MSAIERIINIIRIKFWSRAKRKEQDKKNSSCSSCDTDYSGVVGVAVGFMMLGFLVVTLIVTIPIINTALEATVVSINGTATAGNSTAITSDLSFLFQLLPLLLMLVLPILFIKYMMFVD